MGLDATLTALAWSAIGFAVGWLVCSAYYDLHVLKEAIVPETEHHAARRRHLPALTPSVPNRALGVLLVVLAIVTVASVAVANIQRAQVFDCQSRVNADLVQAINLRGDIAAKDRAALDDLILTIAGAGDLPERQAEKEVQQAINSYVQTIAETRAEREALPYPDPDDFACGG